MFIKMISLELLLVCLVVIYFLDILWRRRNIYRLHWNLMNETWSLPFLGNSLMFLGKDENRMNAIQKFGRIAIRQGGLTSLWLGSTYFVVIADADVAEIVLKTCLAKSVYLNIARELFGNGSIFAPLKIWRSRRKVIAPTFSMRNLNQFVEVFSRQSGILVEQLRGAAGTGTVSVWKYLTSYTMDAVCESALGVEVEAQRHPDQPFLEAFNQHCEMSSARVWLPLFAQKGYQYLPIYSIYRKDIHCMWDFVDRIVKKKRQELLENEKNKLQGYDTPSLHRDNFQKTFLELFMESSGGTSGFTDLELREETLVLLLAGTDTSAVGSAFTCLMLARHPDVQDKIYEEIKDVLGDSARRITAADLPKLKYLEAVVKETLRLYPPVPAILRSVEKDFQLPSGLTMVKGTSILINIWAIHRNPMYWGEDAEEFKPDRFMGSTSLHSAAFIPFSHGPRSCLGYQYAMMSMKTAIANLLRHYRLQPATPTRDRNAPLRVKFDIMMKHVDNFELQVESRH